MKLLCKGIGFRTLSDGKGREVDQPVWAWQVKKRDNASTARTEWWEVRPKSA